MKIISISTHANINFDGNMTGFLHSKDVDFQFQDSWVIVTSKKTGETTAIPSANIPFMKVDMEKKAKGKAE